MQPTVKEPVSGCDKKCNLYTLEFQLMNFLKDYPTDCEITYSNTDVMSQVTFACPRLLGKCFTFIKHKQTVINLACQNTNRVIDIGISDVNKHIKLMQNVVFKNLNTFILI